MSMEPEITEKTDWLEVERTKHGTWWVPVEYIPHWPIHTGVEVPGEWRVFKTLSEARAYLKDMED